MTYRQYALARDRAILTGIIGGFLGRSAGLIAPFVVMPAMLHYLGDVSFGVWMTAVSLTSMAMFVDFGIGNGLLTRLSTAFGAEDYTCMRSYIASAYTALSTIAAVLLVLLAAVLFAVHFGWFGRIIFDANSDSMSIIIICLTTFIFSVPASVIQRVMLANQMTWLSNIWNIIGASLSVMLCLFAIRTALTPWQVIAAYSLPPVITTCASTIWFFGRHPKLRPRVVDYSRKYAADLLRIGARFLALSIVTSIALNADNLIIAQRLGAEAVTAYAIPAKFASLLGLVVTTLFLPLWAANGEAFAKKDFLWIKRTTLKMSLFGGIIVFAVGALLVAFSGVIIQLWMGRTFVGQIFILAPLSLLSVFMAIGSPFQMVLNSLGKLRLQIKAWVIFVITTLSAKYFFVSDANLWIIPMVSAVAYLIFILPQVILGALEFLRIQIKNE